MCVCMPRQHVSSREHVSLVRYIWKLSGMLRLRYLYLNTFKRIYVHTLKMNMTYITFKVLKDRHSQSSILLYRINSNSGVVVKGLQRFMDSVNNCIVRSVELRLSNLRGSNVYWIE